MTLIISALNKSYSCQLSDRRLTKIQPDGSLEVYNDSANKATIVNFKDTFLAMSYTGVGEFINQRTDEWFVDSMTSLKPWRKSPGEFFKEFNDLASRWIKKIENISGENQRHSFVFTGMFNDNIPVLFLSSNFEKISDGKRYVNKEDHFSSTFIKLNCIEKESSALLFIGDHSKVNEGDCEDLISIIKHPNVEVDNFVKKSVKSIRNVAEKSTYIGKNIMSIIIKPNNRMASCHYHPAERSKEAFAPNLITGGILFKGVELYFGNTPPWRNNN